MTASDFISRTRPWLIGAGAVVLAFLVGRGSRPEPVIEVREVERVKTQVVELTRTVVIKASEESRSSRRVVERVKVERPDGTKVEREIEREQAEVEVRRLEVAETKHLLEREHDERRDAELVVAPALPPWRVGVLVGLDIPKLAPVYGAKIERRVLGPVSVGAWGLSNWSVGLSVAVEF